MKFETRLDEAFGIQTTMKKTLFERKLEELDWRKAIGAAGMGLAALSGAGAADAAPAPQVAQAQELGTPTKPKTADDKAAELVQPVRDVYNKDVKVAQDKYKKALDVELEKATKAGSLDDVKAIKKEMEEPEGDESKWKSPTHKMAAKRYTGEVETAKKKWDAGINNLVKMLVQKKELDVAEKVKKMDIQVRSINLETIVLGKWIRVGMPDFTLEFLADGVLKKGDSIGKWYVEDGRIFVIGPKKKLEIFDINQSGTKANVRGTDSASGYEMQKTSARASS